MTKSIEVDKGIISRHKQQEPEYALVNEIPEPGLSGPVKQRLAPRGSIVVGSTLEVIQGYATHISIIQAHEDAPEGGIIFILPGVYTENVTISKNLLIQGWGYASQIAGTLTITSDYGQIKQLRVTDTIGVSGDGNRIELWMPNGTSWSNTGSGNILSLIEES